MLHSGLKSFIFSPNLSYATQDSEDEDIEDSSSDEEEEDNSDCYAVRTLKCIFCTFIFIFASPDVININC